MKSSKGSQELEYAERSYIPKELDGCWYLWEPSIRRACDVLGDALLKACVEYAMSEGKSKNPNPLLIQWERNVRMPLDRLQSPIERAVLEEIFQRIQDIHNELES